MKMDVPNWSEELLEVFPLFWLRRKGFLGFG